jgi:transcriptional regulator with PAS, ATPase and Fis domain
MDISYLMNDFSGAVTVADRAGLIVYMNKKAQSAFIKSGGAELIGKSLSSCHRPESMEKIASIMDTGIPNSYTVEKDGIHRMIHQAPWVEDGKTIGIIEISFEIPAKLPHFLRG